MKPKQTTYSKIPRETLGLAAEFAVASELCRRNIYAQLTLGRRKRTDLLVETEKGMLRIQVKAKQGGEWPNCEGIYGEDIILVFVDFEHKEEDERPDFYILTAQDWRNLVNRELRDRISKGEVVINETSIPVWVKQIKKGKPYKGMGVKAKQIHYHKDCWRKIGNMVGEITD